MNFNEFESLPSWERGLKFHLLKLVNIVLLQSLPSWERGLKCKYFACKLTAQACRSPRGSAG